MYKDYFLITSIFLVIYSVNGMVFSGGLLSRLDLLLQKSIRYNHHKQNYERSLFEGIIPTGLKINKKPTFQPISGNFYQQWNTVLYDTEKRLVSLLLEESEKVIETVEMNITREMDKTFPDYTNSEKTSVREKHKRFEQNLEIRRNKKWEKFKKRERESKHRNK